MRVAFARVLLLESLLESETETMGKGATNTAVAKTAKVSALGIEIDRLRSDTEATISAAETPTKSPPYCWSDDNRMPDCLPIRIIPD